MRLNLVDTTITANLNNIKLSDDIILGLEILQKQREKYVKETLEFLVNFEEVRTVQFQPFYSNTLHRWLVKLTTKYISDIAEKINNKFIKFMQEDKERESFLMSSYLDIRKFSENVRK